MATESNIGGMLIFSVVFLAVLAFLSSMVSIPDLSISERRNATIPEYWEAIDLQYFSDLWAFTMNQTGGEGGGGFYWKTNSDLGGHEFEFVYKIANESDLYLYNSHFYFQWPFTSSHSMEWYNSVGIKRSEAVEGSSRYGGFARILRNNTLDTDYLLDRAEYTVTCDHIEVKIFFSYNETAYSSITDAWNYDSLNVLVALGFDQKVTAFNAWDLIAMILFFQMPDVHPAINFLIAFPIWVSIGYVAVRLILLALPWVG